MQSSLIAQSPLESDFRPFQWFTRIKLMSNEPGNGLDWLNVTRACPLSLPADGTFPCEPDAVILMKGWEESQGARLEATVATEISHPVFEILKTGDGRRYLSFVEPPRIVTEFAAHSLALTYVTLEG